MKTNISAAAALLLSSVSVQAGGLDRSGQGIDIIFQTGNVLQFSIGHTSPSVDGTDSIRTLLNPTGTNPIGNVGDNFLTWSGSVKYDVNDKVSLAFIVDEPYGSDVIYPGASATTALGGTAAIADSTAYTLVGRYKFNDSFSVHGGLRYQTISATVALGGLAYGGLNGYTAAFDNGGAWGYLLGVAYERPDIALRVALTYNSSVDHDLTTTETVRGIPVNLINPLLAPTSTTRVRAPESLNLSFQSGVAANTLVFGSVRYAKYEQTLVSPTFFDAAVNPTTPNSSLTDLENSLDFELGVGRRFNEKWSGRVAIGYQSSGDDNLVSPLAPTNGARYIVVGAAYNVNEKMTIAGGVRYTDLGDALPETGTPDTERANFAGNSAVSVGLQLSIKF